MTVGGWRGRISCMPPTAVHLTVSDPDAVTPGRWAPGSCCWQPGATPTPRSLAWSAAPARPWCAGVAALAATVWAGWTTSPAPADPHHQRCSPGRDRRCHPGRSARWPRHHPLVDPHPRRLPQPVRRAGGRHRQGHRPLVDRHRHTEFLAFLKLVARTYRRRDPQVVLDNYGTHKHPAVRDWLTKHPRIRLHFTPTWRAG
jgi:hypothetical protein